LDVLESIHKIEQDFETQNDWDSALRGYEELLCDDTENLEVLKKIGWCQSRLQKFELAAETFKKISACEDLNAKWDYMIGYQYYSQKKWRESIDWFKSAVEKKPKYLKAKYRLGYALSQCCGSMYRMKSPEFWDALREFNDCEKIWSNLPVESQEREKSTYADVCYQKGKMLIERQKWDDAIESLVRALEIDSRNDDYKYSLGKALFGKGRYNEALEIIRGVKNTYYVKELRASILYNLKKYDEALKIYLDLLGSRKKDYLYRDISQIYLEKNMLGESYQYALNAIKASHSNHKNHFLLAEIYHKAKLYYKAKSELEKAIELYGKKYSGAFTEAVELIQSISSQIEELEITRDDETILEKLVGCPKQEIYRGTVTKYLSDKGYGFITAPDIGKCFFHISKIMKPQQINVCESCEVEFKLEQTEKGPVAVNIKLLK
jgi:tetratricopeptide (TPR) repeat protein/cold shock CspA family protein